MYDWVKKYVGMEFKSGGRTSDGCDCYGLVRLILANEYSVLLPSFTRGYFDANDQNQTGGLFKKYMPLILAEKIEVPEEKALAVIRTRGLCTHVAIYAGDGYMMHIMANTAAVCDRIDNPMLAGRIEGWYRVSQSYCTDESPVTGKG